MSNTIVQPAPRTPKSDFSLSDLTSNPKVVVAVTAISTGVVCYSISNHIHLIATPLSAYDIEIPANIQLYGQTAYEITIIAAKLIVILGALPVVITYLSKFVDLLSRMLSTIVEFIQKVKNYISEDLSTEIMLKNTPKVAIVYVILLFILVPARMNQFL